MTCDHDLQPGRERPKLMQLGTSAIKSVKREPAQGSSDRTMHQPSQKYRTRRHLPQCLRSRAAICPALGKPSWMRCTGRLGVFEVVHVVDRVMDDEFYRRLNRNGAERSFSAKLVAVGYGSPCAHLRISDSDSFSCFSHQTHEPLLPP